MATVLRFLFALNALLIALAASQIAAQQPVNNPAQPGAPLPNGQPAQPQRLAVQPPFTLTPQQQAELDQALTQWEKKSDSVKTFECSVQRFEYDPTFGEPTTHMISQAKADLKYAAPDKGYFRVNQLNVYAQDPQTKKWDLKPSDDLEYWTCDGKSTYEVKHKPNKKIVEHPIPKELQGKAIIDGPLPFVFGAKADMLKGRFFLRIIPSDPAKNQVWIEALPRTQKDAANYAKVEIILNKSDMLPGAIQIYSPAANINGNPKDQPRTVFSLEEPAVNGFKAQMQNWFFDFARPRMLGYTYEVEQPQGLGPPPNPQPTPPGGGLQEAGRVKPAAR